MKLTNRENIIRFKSYYQKTKCGLCEALCISKVTLIFIYMKSKKKKYMDYITFLAFTL